MTGAAAVKRVRGSRRDPAGYANSGMHQSIQFINTTHPRDGAHRNSLSLIRSHVARHGRALQVQREQHSPAAPRSNNTPRRVVLRPRPPGSKTGDWWQQQQQQQTQQETGAHLHEGLPGYRPRGCDTIRGRDSELDLQPAVAPWLPGRDEKYLHRRQAPSPVQLIGGAPRDSYHVFARPLSRDEQYLFDFYLNYVIVYGYTACHDADDALTFHSAMRDIWVPFAMSQPSLMAAVFHVACRNYASVTDNSNTTRFAVKKLQYRHTCLNMAMEAIRTQTLATDTTIALALLMASEAYHEGDLGTFHAHGSGIIKMVAARGGLTALGLFGFLRELVASCIYDPMHHMVMGPSDNRA